MIIRKYNPGKHVYEPYEIPADKTIVLYTEDMNLKINCTNCFKDMVFGDGYTSKELHNPFGLGFPVCESCYEDEIKRDQIARAFGNKVKFDHIEIVHMGNTVLCDQCNKDWTNDKTTGGYLFGSHGVCPDCADRMMISIKKYNEEWNIKGYCPADKSFADWIRSIR